MPTKHSIHAAEAVALLSLSLSRSLGMDLEKSSQGSEGADACLKIQPHATHEVKL